MAGLGGPAAYWTDYTYDPVGNRTTSTDHTAEGASRATYSYPAAGGSRPHAVSEVTEGTQTSSYAYDASGNTVTRAVAGQVAQSLSWDVEGELETVAQDGEGDASFVYTADGDRLIRTQAGATTVYLPGGQELTLSAAGVKSATRYYSWAGQTVAVRTGDGFDDVSTLVNDHHGTASVSITNVSAQISRRYQSPFGESRGTASAGWSGDHGFLDKPVDATGLTAIGARYYDPIIGRFVSVGPVMDLGDPQQWHGYAYAHSSPVTYSDPTGLREVVNDGLNNDTSEDIKKSVDHTRKNGGWGSASVSPPVSVPSNAGGGGHGYGGGGGSTGTPSEYSKVAAVSEEYAGPTADRINAEAIYAMIHLALAAGGMVPVVGELADGLDAAVCGIEGDAVCAALAGTGAIPVAGWGSGAVRIGKNVDRLIDLADTGSEVLRPLSRVEAGTLNDALRPAKLDHVFVPKHNFEPLLARYGTREDAMEQIVRGLDGPGIPTAGRFEVSRMVGGQSVVIRGAVVDSIPRIGTAFTP